MTSRLLESPREIRSLTYPHISRTQEWEWKWEPREYWGWAHSVQVCLYGVPDMGALLTHSRLHEEYLEDQSQSVDITMFLDHPLGISKVTGVTPGSPRSNERAITAFQKVKHAQGPSSISSTTMVLMALKLTWKWTMSSHEALSTSVTTWKNF